ncbi:MAG TPA: universal stress protein [Solirubrobacteraceae bacterium]|nr:universal stress protein [Solirubrobacteraceae bacterium]
MSAHAARTASTAPRPTARCLVVGYDGRPAAQAAACWAAGRLGEQGRLVVVQASRPLHAPAATLGTTEERRRMAGARLDELLLEAPLELLDCEFESEVSDREPVSALIEAAERHGAEAIVLGAQRHSTLQRAIGTVTTELLARSPVPVTVVPDR